MSIFGPTGKEIIQENFWFNSSDVKHNFDQWKPGEDNILYITGLSGGGKTTLTNHYVKKYKAIIFSLDWLDGRWNETFTNPITIKLFKKFPDFKDALKRTNGALEFRNEDDYQSYIKEWPLVVQYLIEIMHKDSNNLYIIEGIQILRDDFPANIEEIPMIIKGTSVIKAISQRVTRILGTFVFSEFIKEFKVWVKVNTNQDKQMKKIKNSWGTEAIDFQTIFIPENGSIITESYKTTRKYKCPYCDYINTRDKLITHIEKKHEEMIPEGYSAGRLIYDLLNKNPNKAKCRICGNPTEWNEDKLRYEVFCSNPNCKKKYSDNFHKVRMVNKYGVESLLSNPEMQDKMLRNRKISGYYKFSDGVKISYCGNYEKNLLEYLDKVMNYRSYDITSPGPVIEYEYKGKTHFWITDQYIGPSNLVIDVKDGGSNPNNRYMPEYREKQLAKEEAIRKLHKYNYIRLSNNEFDQLISVLMAIKYEMLDNENYLKNPIIDINENAGLATSPIGNAIIGTDKMSSFLIPYKPIDNVLDDIKFGLTFDKDLSNIYTLNDEGLIEYKNIKFLFDKRFDVIKSKNKVTFELDNTVHETSFFCELALGIKNLDSFQESVKISYMDELIRRNIIKESIIYECNKDDPLMQISTIGEVSTHNPNIVLREDVNGYFYYNKENLLRTTSCNKQEEAYKEIQFIL